MEERVTEDRNGNMSDLRPTIFVPIESLTNGQPPSICHTQAVTMKPTHGAKFRQASPLR